MWRALSGSADADSRSHARAPVANRSRCRRASPKNRHAMNAMKHRVKPKKQREDEPVGIVISRGPAREAPPLISAYVWGPAPEPARKVAPTRRQPDRLPATTI
jgi:hypothetical protein